MLRIRMNSRLTIGLLVTALLLSPAILRAADVLDGGSFFSADALAQANQKIREIEQKSGHEIRIETFATVPADKVEAVAKMDKSQRETFFTKWQHDRAEATKSRGVFVLICKNPSHLRLWAGTAIQHAGFGTAQAQTVREKLLTGFKAKEYDKTLTDVVAQLATTFEGLSHAKNKAADAGHKPVAHSAPKPSQAPAPHAPAPAAPQASGGNFLFIVVLVIGGILLFSFVARMFGGGGSNVPGGIGGAGYGGGGGGFWSGLTGGLFGAVAGNWLYNQFSDHHASANDTHSPMGDSSNNSGWSDAGSSDSGGNDFGGGDFGGGDGGGDFGGGGDF